MNNKNKQRNSSSLSFLRVKLRFMLKITTKHVLKSICNDNHQNSANFVNFYRIVIFSGCPGQVGRTDKISVLPFFEKFEFSEVTKRYGGPQPPGHSQLLSFDFFELRKQLGHLQGQVARIPNLQISDKIPALSRISRYKTRESEAKQHFKIKDNHN